MCKDIQIIVSRRHDLCGTAYLLIDPCENGGVCWCRGVVDADISMKMKGTDTPLRSMIDKYRERNRYNHQCKYYNGCSSHGKRDHVMAIERLLFVCYGDLR